MFLFDLGGESSYFGRYGTHPLVFLSVDAAEDWISSRKLRDGRIVPASKDIRDLPRYVWYNGAYVFLDGREAQQRRQ